MSNYAKFHTFVQPVTLSPILGHNPPYRAISTDKRHQAMYTDKRHQAITMNRIEQINIFNSKKSAKRKSYILEKS